MPRYDNYGQLDTQILSAGDTAFQSMNNRLRPDQLQPGQLAYSQNGRMDIDGAWQVRKGIDSFGQVLSSNTSALTLPFYLYESETITSASRVNSTVTVNLAPLATQILETAINSTHGLFRQILMPAGNYYAVLSCYVKRSSADRSYVMFGDTSDTGISDGNSLDGALPCAEFELFDGGSVSAGTGVIEDVGNDWYRISVSKQFILSSAVFTQVGLDIVSGSGQTYLGDITKGVQISDWQLEISTSDTTPSRYSHNAATASGTNLISYSNNFSNAAWSDKNTTISSAVQGPGRIVSGSVVCLSDVSGSVNPTGNRLVTVVNGSQFTFTIPGATGSESYVLGGSPLAGAPRLENNLNACYGSCRFSDPKDDNAEYIIEATYDKAVAISLDDGTATDIAYPSGVTISSPVNLLQVFDRVFIFRDGATALEWDGDFTGTPAFAKVANGTYTYPVYLNASSNTVIADGVVTVSETGHGLSVGDQIYVVDEGSSTLTVDQGGYTVATVPNANTFTFYAQVADMTSHSVVYSKRGSEGRGFTHMPAPPWAIYHQRRLIVPFNYTTTGTPGSEVITDRERRDELLCSDVLDSDTYDMLQNQFRVTAGIADYLQTAHPFTDDNAVAFNRNSMHLISGLSGSLADVSIKEITRETGLVARRSVVTIGNAIYFLSDNGIYAIEFGDLYNLRGAGLPLSAAIEPIIKRINVAAAANAVAVYYNNRYWIALPLDNSTVNNTLLVYNILNGGWESVDTVDSADWDIANLIVAGSADIYNLYAVNRFGGLHILDAREDDKDRLALYPGASATTYAIDSYATTREYTGGVTDRKKFNSFEAHIESSGSNASNAAIEVETENLDTTVTLGQVSDYLGAVLPVGEDASIRGRIGNLRAYGLQMTFSPSQGRPKFRMVRINAIPAFNSLNSAS